MQIVRENIIPCLHWMQTDAPIFDVLHTIVLFPSTGQMDSELTR